MRPFAAAVLVLAVLTGCGHGPGDAECRASYEDERQTLGENGNPGTATTPRLTAHWDALRDRLAEGAQSAVGADCVDELPDLLAEVEAVSQVLYAVGELDLVDRLRRAETDLDHAEATRDYDPPPPVVVREFAALRRAVPRATAALAGPMAELDAVDPRDDVAVGRRLAALRAVADADPDVRRVREALAAIAELELHEE